MPPKKEQIVDSEQCNKMVLGEFSLGKFRPGKFPLIKLPPGKFPGKFPPGIFPPISLIVFLQIFFTYTSSINGGDVHVKNFKKEKF